MVVPTLVAWILWTSCNDVIAGNPSKLVFNPWTTKIVSSDVLLFTDSVLVNCPNVRRAVDIGPYKALDGFCNFGVSNILCASSVITVTSAHVSNLNVSSLPPTEILEDHVILLDTFTGNT